MIYIILKKRGTSHSLLHVAFLHLFSSDLSLYSYTNISKQCIKSLGRKSVLNFCLVFILFRWTPSSWGYWRPWRGSIAMCCVPMAQLEVLSWNWPLESSWQEEYNTWYLSCESKWERRGVSWSEVFVARLFQWCSWFLKTSQQYLHQCWNCQRVIGEWVFCGITVIHVEFESVTYVQMFSEYTVVKAWSTCREQCVGSSSQGVFNGRFQEQGHGGQPEYWHSLERIQSAKLHDTDNHNESVAFTVDILWDSELESVSSH